MKNRLFLPISSLERFLRKCGRAANNHNAMPTMTAAATMRGGHWGQCDDVTISHECNNVRISQNEVKSHEWQQRLCWRTRGCSGSCVCKQRVCCRQTGDCGGQEAPADGKGKSSEDDKNKGNKEKKGNKGKGNILEIPSCSTPKEGNHKGGSHTR
jgi:hypothetical protein